MNAELLRKLAGRRRLARGTGFTLVELMVAMTGGLFLSIMVFALSRDASRFYQREGRVANATLSGVAGFERLSNDVARAGHMSTGNIARDPRVCNRPQAAWPAAVRNLRALTIEPGPGLTAGTEIASAGIVPQGIVIAGALDTPETLYANSVIDNGVTHTLFINLDTPSAARLGLSSSADATASNLAVLTSAFMVAGNGRIVRLRHQGSEQYGVVANVNTAAGQATVTLAATPRLQQRTSAARAAQCGFNGNGTGTDISIINVVRYDIRSMVNDANYAALFAASSSAGIAAEELRRAELVRVELDVNGAEIAATREIVAEYAVDLQFTAWRANTDTDPELISVPATDLTATYARTQLLRGMHVRLSVRSREADRAANVSTGGGSSGDIYRIALSSGGSSASATPFARVRTFQSDVPLRNLENSNWL